MEARKPKRANYSYNEKAARGGRLPFLTLCFCLLLLLLLLPLRSTQGLNYLFSL